MMHPNPVWLSWSSGKDSYAALRALQENEEYEVASTFTVVDESSKLIPMHGVHWSLVNDQLASLGLTPRFVPLVNGDIRVGMEQLIKDAETQGIKTFAFGDLFLENIRQTRERNMSGTGIGTLFPLWQLPTETLLRKLIESGMRAVVTSVDLEALPSSFLGTELTLDFIDQLVLLGCDPCGENGEYHSFVFDGPLFEWPVRFSAREVQISDRYLHLPLTRPVSPELQGAADELDSTGMAVFNGPSKLAVAVEETATALLKHARCDPITLERFHDAMTVEELLGRLASGINTGDQMCQQFLTELLQNGHEILAVIHDAVIPLLVAVARELGISADQTKAIARFRIASPCQSIYDHRWHQDSIDPPMSARNVRNTNVGFWIPLHQIRADQGAIEVAIASHLSPISHNQKDPSGRLCFADNCVGKYEKAIPLLSPPQILALDGWVAHRTLPNTDRKGRAALLVWF